MLAGEEERKLGQLFAVSSIVKHFVHRQPGQRAERSLERLDGKWNTILPPGGNKA